MAEARTSVISFFYLPKINIMINSIMFLFLLNFIAHLISFKKLKKASLPNTTGVLSFGIVNLVLALLVLFDFGWVKWLAIIVPAVGALGLCITTLFKNKGIWVDYLILVLDLSIIVLSYIAFFKYIIQ